MEGSKQTLRQGWLRIRVRYTFLCQACIASENSTAGQSGPVGFGLGITYQENLTSSARESRYTQHKLGNGGHCEALVTVYVH